MSNNNPKPDFNALFKLGTFTVNVPSDVHNADVNPSENNVIKTNGTYNVPNGKSGWNSFSVNVNPTITSNVADLMITNDVYDYVKKHYDGMVILPGNDSTVIEETMFDTHGKDYATGLVIDLNFLKTELKIDPNHQKIRLSEDEEDFEVYDYEKDGDYDVRVKPKPEPEQEPEPTKNKSKYITFKSSTRDIIEDDPTYRNIGSFTIVAPILNSIVLPAGTYTFDIGVYNNENNTDYLGVKTITFTPENTNYYLIQDQSFTLTQNPQTFNIPDSYNENILPTIDTVYSLSNYISTGYGGNSSVFYYSRSNEQQYLDRIFSTGGSNQYWYAYGTRSTNINTNTTQGAPNILGFNLGDSIKIKNIEFYLTGAPDEFYLLGSNDINFYDTMINMNDNGTILNYINNDLTPSNIIWHQTGIPISNNVFHKEYKIFNNDNPSYKNYVFIFICNINDRNWCFINGLKFISNFKNAMKSVTITSNLPTVNNADVNSQNNNIINQNAEYIIPSDKTGWNSFEVNVQPRLEEISGLEYTSNGNYGITTNWGYDGIQSAYFKINVPQTLYSYPTITTNGTYIIPENYVGLNVIKVNIDPANPNPPNPPAKPTKEATGDETIMLENGTYWSGLWQRNSNGEFIVFGDISRDFNGIYIHNWSSPEYNTFILSRNYGTGMTEFIVFTIKNNREANYPITIANDLTNEYTYRNEWDNNPVTIYAKYSNNSSFSSYVGWTTYGPVTDLGDLDSSTVNVSSLLKTTLYIETGTD